MAGVVTNQRCQVMADARAAMAKFLKDRHKGWVQHHSAHASKCSFHLPSSQSAVADWLVMRKLTFHSNKHVVPFLSVMQGRRLFKTEPGPKSETIIFGQYQGYHAKVAFKTFDVKEVTTW